MLSIIEARVLGCLMEKERTVPDQYPLTLNVLVSACNQSTSREPVMRLEEHEVQGSITAMKASGVVRIVHPSHGRSVTRYRHVADEHYGMEPAEAALVAVMLLRGPQTVSELRIRTERQHPFVSPDEVEQILRDLANRGHVRLLERQPGQKELRWQQLIAEEPASVAGALRSQPGHEQQSDAAQVPPAASAFAADDGLAKRVVELEARVAKLEAALADLL